MQGDGLIDRLLERNIIGCLRQFALEGAQLIGKASAQLTAQFIEGGNADVTAAGNVDGGEILRLSEQFLLQRRGHILINLI